MTISNKKRAIISALLCLVLGLCMFAPFLIPASAESTSHSNVLDDLGKDEKFNAADYPNNPNDYSLKVIQIAEGSNGELFIYVYQPSAATKPIVATSINISVEQDQKNIRNYTLELVSSESVFQ